MHKWREWRQPWATVLIVVPVVSLLITHPIVFAGWVLLAIATMKRAYHD